MTNKKIPAKNILILKSTRLFSNKNYKELKGS